MLSNIAVNYYRSIHPFLGSPFHQKVVVQINGVVSGVNWMKVLEYCPLSKKTGSLQRVPSSLQHALPAQKGVFHMIFYTLFQRRVKMYPVPAWIRHCCFPQRWRRADCAHRSSPSPCQARALWCGLQAWQSCSSLPLFPLSRALALEVVSLQYIAAKSSPLVCIAHTSLFAWRTQRRSCGSTVVPRHAVNEVVSSSSKDSNCETW